MSGDLPLGRIEVVHPGEHTFDDTPKNQVRVPYGSSTRQTNWAEDDA